MTVSDAERLSALARRLAEDLVETRESLARLESEVGALTQDLDEEGGVPTTHMADEGSDVFDIERLQTLRRDLEDRITQIELAQQRIADGTYGTCAHCGKQIPLERLEALPHATLCIDCQAVQER